MKGLILASLEAVGRPGVPCGLVRIGGISLLERHVRQMKQAGVREVQVLVDEARGAVDEELLHLRRACWPVEVKRLIRDAQGVFGAEVWLVTRAETLLDDRLLPALAHTASDGVAVAPTEGLFDGIDESAGLLMAGGRVVAFAAARLCGTKARRLVEQVDHEDRHQTLQDAIDRREISVIDVSTLPTYSYEMRRHQPYLFKPIWGEADNPEAKRLLLDAAQKSVLDWPAWYLHRPIEKWLIYHLCEWPITPNQLTLLNNVVAFFGVYLFAGGDLLWGMATALAVGVLDGLDGKQARVKVMTSQFGRIEEVLDKIYENAWFLAMAYWLSSEGWGALAYAAFGVILACNLADVAIGLHFRKRRGVQLDDVGTFERRFRVVSGRRNTYAWTLVPFALAASVNGSAWWFLAGLAVVAVYALVTVGVRAWRMALHLGPPNAASRATGPRLE